MPERIKFGGHYTLKFFVTPDEFADIYKFLELKQAAFRLSTLAAEIHGFAQVLERYTKFYNYFAAEEKPDGFASFIYAIDFTLGSEKPDLFFVRNEPINWIYQNKWPEDDIQFPRIMFTKGFQINLGDEKGKYYIYEDIREHQPLSYAFWKEVTDYIKSITKPFRFFVPTADSFKEEKPASARISERALSEINKGWYFKKYQLRSRKDMIK
ncbi:MAG: hypothetical protein FWD48_02770 [Oscillospiraceae bacterium]|nr:hypothetical protein [Oscillospiraceae bacterium]